MATQISLFYVAWLVPHVHQLHLEAHLHLLRLPGCSVFVDFMDGKKKFEARHLTPQCYHSTHTHVHTHGSCLETTGYNHTCQVKSVSNWPQTFMCLDLALLLLRNITSWTWFTVGTSLRFNLSACSCLELSQLSLAMRSPRDQALEQQVPLLSRSNPTMQFWPSAQCDFHHNAPSIQWLHVWQYCVLAHMNPDVNPSKLSSQSNPVIRPSHEGVPHSIGIRKFSLRRALAEALAHIWTRWWSLTSIFLIKQTK